jgi:pilus assembly protein Flp/PilA
MTRPAANPIRALARDTRGASFVEYVILVGVVAILALAGFRQFGSSIRFKVDQQATTVSNVNDR